MRLPACRSNSQVDDVLAAARESTGLADFGPDDFLERLGLLVDEWGSDAAMRPLQRLNLRNYLVRYAATACCCRTCGRATRKYCKRHIREPIIVAGLPRSGTTHLVNLLAADRRLRSLPLWESYEPVPLPGEAPLADGTDPRYQRCAEAWAGMQATLPLLAAMHPMNPDHIHEELELMGPDFASYNFEWLSPSPRWRDHYYAHDQTPHYEYMKNVLRTSRIFAAPSRWVLKCPQHMEQLPVLKQVFPDATVVITHRDPIAVIQSSVTMIAYGARMRLARIDTDGLTAVLERPHRAHAARLRARSRRVPGGAEPRRALPRVHGRRDRHGGAHPRAGRQPAAGAGARARSQRFLAEHPRGKEGRVVYDMKRDFGIEPAQLRQRFAFYFEAFPQLRTEA